MFDRIRNFLKLEFNNFKSKKSLKNSCAEKVNFPDEQGSTEGLHFYIEKLSRGEVDDCIQIEGWLYSESQDYYLIVEMDGQAIYKFKSQFVRQDVCLEFPSMDPEQNIGFKVDIPVSVDKFSHRGACEVSLFYVSGEAKKLLAKSVIFHRHSYVSKKIDTANNFHFTIASSNINLGGLGDFKEKLAPFAIGSCKLGFMVPVLYMRSTLGAENDWEFDPDFDERRRQANGKLVLGDSLRSILNYSVKHQIPCVIGLNGGIWSDAAGSCPEWDLTDHLEELEENCQWNQRNEVMPDDYLKHLTGAELAPELSRSLTLNHYNESVRFYKKRNLQQVAQYIVNFYQQYPQLYIGSNLDPDCYHNPFFEGEQWYDFNPQTLEQYRHWLAGTGVYQDELKHCIKHVPWSLQQLNKYLSSQYKDWADVTPPRHIHCTPSNSAELKALTLWEQFRRHIIHRHYSDLSAWLVAMGLPERMIFSSQGFTAPRGRIDPFALRLNSPLKNYDSGGMSLEGSKPEQGHIGAILYGESARNAIRTENELSFFQSMKALDSDWAVVEFNPADLRDDAQTLPDYGYSWSCLREMFNHGARFVNLMAWNGCSGRDRGVPGFNAHMALRDTPLELAVVDFMLMYADVARGDQCYTFGTHRYTSLDGWCSARHPLAATVQGLRVSLIEGLAQLCAPQPYLYHTAEMIEFEYLGSLTDDLSIALEVNGTRVDCICQQEWHAERGLTVYQLTPKAAFPHEIERFHVSINAASSLKELYINRVIFRAGRPTATMGESQ